MQIKIEMKNGRAAAEHLDRQLAYFVGNKVARAKVTFIRQALTAIADLLPVWSGKTQNSIVVSEGYRRSPEKKSWDRAKAYGHTGSMPLGGGMEPMANRARILAQAANVKPQTWAKTALEAIYRASGTIYIVAASPATDAGIFEGRAPTPSRARNPSNMAQEILTRGAAGTSFARS